MLTEGHRVLGEFWIVDTRSFVREFRMVAPRDLLGISVIAGWMLLAGLGF